MNSRIMSSLCCAIASSKQIIQFHISHVKLEVEDVISMVPLFVKSSKLKNLLITDCKFVFYIYFILLINFSFVGCLIKQLQFSFYLLMNLNIANCDF